jgi:membrane associated rhomboid family serine protease
VGTGSLTYRWAVPPVRHVRFLPFILTGAVLGFVVGAALALFGWFQDPNPTIASNYAPTAGVGYLGLLGAVLFGLLAAVLALVIERRSDRP